MDEKQLIYNLKKGDESAFQQLFETYKDRVYNTILGMVKSVEDADDLTQEVFVDVYLNIENFKEEAKISTWMYRIAVNKTLNFNRLKNAKKRFSHLLSIFNLAPNDDAPDFIHPAFLLENKEKSEEINRAINALPSKQKTAFMLRQLEDLSYVEIAEIMQTTTHSVESLLFRAKQNLQKKITN